MRTTRFLGGHGLRRLCLLIACMLTALVAACGSSQTAKQTATAPSTPSSAVASGSASAAKITISNFQFTSPQSVAPGSTVAVVNSDSAEHSVTADQGGKFNVDVDGNGTATFTAPTEPGTYAYHCSYHPMMHGQLIVQ